MPGSGPGGVPAAIALTPILSARYREADLERIRAAAPGARLVTISLEGLADGPLDDVEVMLRGPLPAATFERILVRAPRLALGALRDGRRGAGADARGGGPGPGHHQRPRGLLRSHRGVRADDDPGHHPAAAAAAGAAARADVAAAARDRDARHRRSASWAWGPSVARSRRCALGFGARVIATRRSTDATTADPALAGIDRVLRPDQLPELLAESDMVVLALPLTRDTTNLFDARMLAADAPRVVAHQRRPRRPRR